MKDHKHSKDCNCEKHHPGGSVHDNRNPCPTEKFVENLLKDIMNEKKSDK